MRPKIALIRLVFCSLIFCMDFLSTYAQSPKLDSLRAQILKSADDTSRVNLYYTYGAELENGTPDSALWYYDLAKERADILNFHKGQAAYASHAITILNNKGKFREALKISKEALQTYTEIGSKRDIAVALLNVGSEWHYLSDFQLATDNYLKALQIAEEINDKHLQRITNNNLASIFINLKDFKKGKLYANKSLKVAEELKDEYAIASSTFNIATSELYLKEYKNALQHYSEIGTIGEKTDDYILILDGSLGIADVFNAMDNSVKALEYYKRVIGYSIEKQAPEYEMYAYIGLAELFLKKFDHINAQKNISKGIALANQLGSNFELKDLYEKASLAAERSGAFEEALEYRKKYEILNDTIVGENSRSNINLLEAKFESEKKEAMIKRLESDKIIQNLTIRQKNIFSYILIAAILTLLLLGILVYRNYTHKQKLQHQRISELEKEKQLTATEAVLKGEEQERTRLAKDLHDGLGGMLSGIKYSFETMKGNLIMTPDNQQAFERSMDMLDSSIREMRRVAHNMMPESLVKFGLDTALKDFCNEINTSGALKINYQSIGMTDALIDQTMAITIYRIVQELINNTMKHATAKTAIVQLYKTDTLLAITVEDDGKGFNSSELEEAQGMGWANIKNRVDFLKGTIHLDSVIDSGTSVHIEIKI